MYVSAQTADTAATAFEGAQLSQQRVTSYVELVACHWQALPYDRRRSRHLRGVSGEKEAAAEELPQPSLVPKRAEADVTSGEPHRYR